MLILTSCLTGVGVFLQIVGMASSFGALRLPFNSSLVMAFGSGLCALAAKLQDGLLGAGICTACTILHLSLWWNNRGGGGRFKKAAKALGNKGQALIRALVDQLSPVPQGVAG